MRISEPSIFIGQIRNVWGHIISENICKIWFLHSEAFKTLFSSYKLVYMPWDHHYGPYNKNYQKFFEILGVDINSMYQVKESTIFDELIVPDDSFWKNNDMYYFTSEYRESVDIVRQYACNNFVKNNAYKKVFYAHTTSKFDFLSNEKRISKYFEKQGYLVVYPEKHSLDEQLNILQNCTDFASTIGSCSHNSIFLNDKTNVILIPRSHFINQFQITLNKVNNLNISYIDSALSYLVSENSPKGPFLFILSEELLSHFKDNNKSNFFWYRNLLPMQFYDLQKIFLKNIEDRVAPYSYSKRVAHYEQVFFNTSILNILYRFITKRINKFRYYIKKGKN